MKIHSNKTIASLVLLIILILITVTDGYGQKIKRLKVSKKNLHYLVTVDNKPFFLNVDAVWGIVWRISRPDVIHYLKKRKEQKFNCIHFCTFPNFEPWNITSKTVYGDSAFAIGKNNKPDPLQPLVTPGSNPKDSAEYDYWDHLDFIVDQIEKLGLYVMLLPTYGNLICGNYDGSDTSHIIFNEKNAYAYGNWIGSRYRKKSHIIWVMGGDRNPVYGARDCRPVIRAMAEGVADGVNNQNKYDKKADYTTTFMTYHPRKWSPNSSFWFHDEPWLDFNSIQDMPLDQIHSVTWDWHRKPIKPTWLYEGRYELYKYQDTIIYKPWQVRYQAYQTVFAGGCGIAYSCHGQYDFLEGWKTKYLTRPGAIAMTHLYRLMREVLTDREYMDRMPDQGLISNTQRPHMNDVTLSSDQLQGTRGADNSYALIYSARGGDIKVFVDKLKGPSISAYWYNPRTGKWHVKGKEYKKPRPFAKGIRSGPGAPVYTFSPPHGEMDKNDWVLRLTVN
jgi:hypothetical protein